MLTNAQKNVLIHAARIRLDQGEDIREVFRSYANLSDEEKQEILSYFSLAPIESGLEEIKSQKILELSAACRKAIEAGVTLEIDGISQHFPYSLSDGDQNNIAALFYISRATGLPQPYHCQGGSCRLYSPDQLAALYIAEEANKAAQETYFNQLKLFILETFTKEEDIPQVKAVSYGDPLTGKYLDNYNSIAAQNQETIQVLSNP